MKKTKLTGKETLMEAASVLADGNCEAQNMFLRYLLHYDSVHCYQPAKVMTEVADFFVMVDQLGLSGKVLGDLYTATRENLHYTATLFFALHANIISEAQLDTFIKTRHLSVDGINMSNADFYTFYKIEKTIEEKYPAARAQLLEDLAQQKRETLEKASPAARKLYLKLEKNPELAELGESEEDRFIF